jgi:hypothetical protein
MNNDRQIHEFASYKRSALVRALDRLCQELELSPSRYDEARQRYESVGGWLAGSENRFLSVAAVYPQGSIAIGTTVKPLNQTEFDVDLVCFLPTIGATSSPAVVKALVGDRLKEHGHYEGMLEEKQRCWRINYANEFHLDITPAISNEMCVYGGEFVPDKSLRDWKPTNPRGYKSNFERRAALRPRFYTLEKSTKITADSVDSFPEQELTKPPLKRLVQLLKRHRDQVFSGKDVRELMPISVIVTTLAANAYEYCVTNHVYVDMYELLCDVIRRMPDSIRRVEVTAQTQYFIDNDATVGENFAEKWNRDPRLPVAFYNWHKRVLDDLSQLVQIEGQDVIAEHFIKSYGATRSQATAALGSPIVSATAARSNGSLLVVPAFGLTTTIRPGATQVRPNTFFGD